jgi:hypothetical protein
MRSWFSLALAAAFGSALIACASTTIRAADYDQSCASDRDCVVVFEGDLCSMCCNDGAINIREEQRYRRDRERAKKACGEQIIQCAPCGPAPVTCQRGRCAVWAEPDPAPGKIGAGARVHSRP